MDAALQIALLWLLFGGSHVLLALGPVRRFLTARLGEIGFLWAFGLIAWASFTLLVIAYARVQLIGPAGFALADHSAVRAALVVAIVFGIVLIVGASAPTSYFESPTAVLVEGVPPVTGLARITRHPFFSGTVLLMGSHALLAQRLTGTIFFSGFAILAIVGPLHQARKLRARHGRELAKYFAETSAVPFLAILRGRQRLVLRELPWKTLALSPLVVFGLHRFHDGILAHDGAPFIAVIVGSTLLIMLLSMRKSSLRQRSKSAPTFSGSTEPAAPSPDSPT